MLSFLCPTDPPMAAKIHYIVFIYVYEGCPSKTWTFVIARDFVSGILCLFYGMFIYILETFCKNMVGITI